MFWRAAADGLHYYVPYNACGPQAVQSVDDLIQNQDSVYTNLTTEDRDAMKGKVTKGSAPNQVTKGSAPKGSAPKPKVSREIMDQLKAEIMLELKEELKKEQIAEIESQTQDDPQIY